MKSWMKPWMNPGYLNESCAGILQGWCHFILGVLEKANTHQPRKKLKVGPWGCHGTDLVFFHLEKLQCPASSSVDAWKQCGKAAHLPFHPSHEVCPETSRFSTFKLHDFSDSECALDPYGSIWSKLKLNFGMECHISLLWVEQADIMIAAVWVALKARKKALRTLNIIYNALVFEVTKMCWVLRYY